MPVDPHLQGFLDLVAAASYPPMHEGSPDDARKGFAAMAALTGDPIPVGSVEDIDVEGCPARVYRPAVEGPVPTVLFLHGGGFVIGDLDTHDRPCRRLCTEAGVVVVALDYRLAPEDPFPAAVEDAVAAGQWVLDNLASLGGAPVAGVAGDSAGGNLSAVVTQAVPGFAAQLLVYPAVDPHGDYPSRVENAEGYFLEDATMRWFYGHYVGAAAVVEDDVRGAPLRAASLAGLPPAVVVTAEFDPLRDEGLAYAAALREAGVPTTLLAYDGLIHGFLNMDTFSPAADRAVGEVYAAFRALL